MQYMLTTTDNPFDPFTHYDEWFAWDQAAGYNTPGYLARIVRTSEELSEADQELDIERGIDEIIRLNPLPVYRKVAKSS